MTFTLFLPYTSDDAITFIMVNNRAPRDQNFADALFFGDQSWVMVVFPNSHTCYLSPWASSMWRFDVNREANHKDIFFYNHL